MQGENDVSKSRKDGTVVGQKLIYRLTVKDNPVYLLRIEKRLDVNHLHPTPQLRGGVGCGGTRARADCPLDRLSI